MFVEISDIFASYYRNDPIDGVTSMKTEDAGKRYFAALQSMADTLSENVSSWHKGFVLSAGEGAFREWKFVTYQPQGFNGDVRGALVFIKSSRADHWSLTAVRPEDYAQVARSIKIAFLIKAAREEVDLTGFAEFEYRFVRHSWDFSESTFLWKRGEVELIKLYRGRHQECRLNDKLVNTIIYRLNPGKYHVEGLSVPQGTELDPEPPRERKEEMVPVPRGWWPLNGSGADLLEHFDVV